MISAPTKLLRDAYRALHEEAELAANQRAAERLQELQEIEDALGEQLGDAFGL